jgi:hypothetical protein
MTRKHVAIAIVLSLALLASPARATLQLEPGIGFVAVFAWLTGNRKRA